MNTTTSGKRSTACAFRAIEVCLEIDTWKDFHRLFSPAVSIISAGPGNPQEKIAKGLPVDLAEDFYYNSPQKMVWLQV